MIIDPSIFAISMGFAMSTGWCIIRIIHRKSAAEGVFHTVVLIMLIIAAVLFKMGIS